MTEELYINGTLMDIENVDIVRKYISPFFRDVNILRNNGSYTVKLPPTATNLKAFGLSDRLDMFSDIPYQVNAANYYYDGFPVFENADCILIGVAEDGFIEVQFTWGLSKSKYLPLFEKKLNEIVPNGTTILESDWIVEWKKSNVVYNTGKKYRYLDYVSGERESDVRILDGEVQPMAQAPEPFKSNLKEMTMHPFVEFSDMLDLIVNDTTNLASNVFDDLKPRLLNKGLILGGNKDNKEYLVIFLFSGGRSGAKGLIFPVDGTRYLEFQQVGTGSTTRRCFRKNKYIIDNSILNIDIHIDFVIEGGVGDIYLVKRRSGTEIDEIIYTLTRLSQSGGYDTYDTTLNLDLEADYLYHFKFQYEGSPSENYEIPTGSITFNYSISKNVYAVEHESISPALIFGRYNCLMNLPEMTFAEFIQQMLIMTGMFIGYDKNGDIRFISFDDLKDNVQSGTAYNRSGRIGEITKNEYRFENFAQRNIIKFNNSDDVGYVAHGELTVNDLTLEKERDMYVIKFDLAEQSADGKAEFILYKQRVTENEKGGEIEKGFENNYSEKPSVCVYDDNGVAKILQVLPNSLNGETGFIETYYGVMQKIIERPRVIECEDNMDVITSANIDYEKPFYADELGGRYAVLLELQAPNNEPCVAKLLLINQKL
jgi:hypothetical protein